GAKGERLALAAEAVVHAPELAAGRPDPEIEPFFIRQLAGLVAWFGLADGGIGKGHDGIPRGGCRYTVKSTVKSDGMACLLVLRGDTRKNPRSLELRGFLSLLATWCYRVLVEPGGIEPPSASPLQADLH